MKMNISFTVIHQIDRQMRIHAITTLQNAIFPNHCDFLGLRRSLNYKCNCHHCFCGNQHHNPIECLSRLAALFTLPYRKIKSFPVSTFFPIAIQFLRSFFFFLFTELLFFPQNTCSVLDYINYNNFIS